MRILAIDPATYRVGYAIMDSDRMTRVTSGSWRMADVDRDSRLAGLWDHLSRIGSLYKFEVVAVEDGYMKVMSKAMLMMAEARGVVKAFAASCGAKILSIAPSTAKKAMTGSGKADKGYVMSLACQRFGVNECSITEDEADALAIGVAACGRV